MDQKRCRLGRFWGGYSGTDNCTISGNARQRVSGLNARADIHSPTWTACNIKIETKNIKFAFHGTVLKQPPFTTTLNTLNWAATTNYNHQENVPHGRNNTASLFQNVAGKQREANCGVTFNHVHRRAWRELAPRDFFCGWGSTVSSITCGGLRDLSEV